MRRGLWQPLSDLRSGESDHTVGSLGYQSYAYLSDVTWWCGINGDTLHVLFKSLCLLDHSGPVAFSFTQRRNTKLHHAAPQLMEVGVA